MAVSRRSFMQIAAAASAVSAAGGAVSAVMGNPAGVAASSTGLNKFRGRVAINFNKGAVSADNKANAEVVKKMVEESILLLTGKTDVGEAWLEIFPSTITATSHIAIKTNYYALAICPPPAALLGMVEGLRKMKIGGAAFTGKITIYEGNTSNDFAKAKYETAAFEALNATLTKVSSYASKKDPAEGETGGYAAVLDEADFLINVFSARGHDAFTEGLSLGFKSHYGSYTNQPMSTIHADGGFSQRVRNLQCTGVISKKQVLSVSCAFFCNNEGTGMGSPNLQSFETYVKTMDPAATCTSPSTIIMSTDAISCEMQVIKLLRLNKGKTNWGVSDMPKYLRASAGVSGVLTGTTYNIGEIDESKMKIGKMINGVVITPVAATAPDKVVSHSTYLQATPLHGQGITHFEFKLPSLFAGTVAYITVHDLRGRLVFSQEVQVRGALNHFSWDQRTGAGAKVGAGKYISTLKAGNVGSSAAFVLS